MPRLQFSLFMHFLSCLISFALLASSVRGDAAPDTIRKQTPFKDFSLDQVRNGDVLQNRQGLADTPDVEAIQTCFLIKAPVGVVASTLANWNPAGKGLDVASHRILTPPVSSDAFKSTLGPFLSSSKGGTWLSKQSKAVKGSELMLSEAEKSLLAAATTPEALLRAWSNLLASRFHGGASGNFNSLLATVRKIGPVDFSGPSDGTSYWELSDLNGRGSISEGVTWKDGSHICDGEFFVTTEYTASFDISTLWPVTVDGKSATVVWRIDSALSPQFADLKGAERLASGSLLLSSVKKAIQAIREKSEK